MTGRRPPARPLLLLAAVAVSYASAFRGVFQFDDFNVIVENPVVHSFAAFFRDLPNGIRPLLKLSYLLNWTAGGGPFGFHLVNLVLHAASTLLVYRLARRAMEGEDAAGVPDGEPVPFVAAFLFAIHPVQTEAVTYISGRSMSMMAFFSLSSLFAYVRGADGGKGWRFVASPLLFACAVLTKETAVTLPVALVLWEVAVRKGNGSLREIALRQAPHWALLLFFAAALAFHGRYRELLVFGFGARGLAENLLTQVHGVAYLMSRLVRIDALNIDPELPVHVSWSPVLMAEAAFLAGSFFLGAVLLRKRPAAGFGLLWFFLQILPTNSVVPRLDVANERHLYMASWGIFLAAGDAARLARASIPGKDRWLRAPAFAAAAILIFFTVARTGVYRSEVVRWEETARLSGGKARVYNNLGYAYHLAGEPDRAIPAYRRALGIDPGFRLARGNLAVAEAESARRRITVPETY